MAAIATMLISAVAVAIRDAGFHTARNSGERREAIHTAIKAAFLSASAAELRRYQFFCLSLIEWSTGDRRLIREGACRAALELRLKLPTLKVDGRTWLRDTERVFLLDKVACICGVPDCDDPVDALRFTEAMRLESFRSMAREDSA